MRRKVSEATEEERHANLLHLQQQWHAAVIILRDGRRCVQLFLRRPLPAPHLPQLLNDFVGAASFWIKRPKAVCQLEVGLASISG